MPPCLQYLNGIRTANNDAHSDPNDLEFLCFDVEEPVRVYVLFDARAYDQPQWLKNKFVDRHTEVIENTNEPALPYSFSYQAASPKAAPAEIEDDPGMVAVDDTPPASASTAPEAKST